ncbi:MAG: calcineurin-like phosphoesterase C-terminal domain-containing protein [Bacteroidales bacterium]|nr:calcineurin-like phosphoesterase C-terminal domain-containing protein [Bacteroidales bacterium]
MNRRFFLSLLAGIVAACASKKVLDPETEPGDPGEVTDDRMLNGTKIMDGHNLYGVILDDEGHPVRNVPVSDGYRYVRTDDNGVYQTKADKRATHVYYSLPAGYAIEQDATSHLPSFYRRIDPSASDIRNDFTLKKLGGASTAFSFAVLGDIHIRDAATAAQFKSGAMARIGQYFKDNAPAGPSFGISLGDIINNAKDPETYGYAKSALGSADCGNGRHLPFFTVIGNHDHNARMGDASQSGTDGFDLGTALNYSGAFGPTCYSFNVGAVHFVVLDNYISQKAPTSAGSALSGQGRSGLSDDVWKWLEKDLSFVGNKASKMIVVCQHCHVRGFTDIPHRDELVAQMSAFHSAYIFSGHAHICETYKYSKVKAQNGNPVMERIHGVPMGNFWYSIYSPDSSPAAFYIYHVNGNDFSSWEHICVHDAEDHMRLYDSNDVYDRPTDWSHQYAWEKESLFAGGNFLLAHIYDGDEDWEVTLEHGGESHKMTFANKRIYDYCAHSHLANDNIAGIRTSWKYHWDSSENWWYIKLDRPASELSGWRVVAKAKFPGSSETKTYTCDRITRSLTESV